MIQQLDPPLPLETPKGRGWAHLMIDYSQEHDLLWVVFLNDTGECWTFPNADVRMVNNISLGRYVPDLKSYNSFGSRNPPWQHGSVLGNRGDGQTPAGSSREGAVETPG